jgi:hypothetical protein
MPVPRRSLRLVTLAVLVTLPLIGTSAVASAKVAKVKGCHKTHTCKSGGGGAGSGGGTGGAPAQMTVQIDPTPVVETTESGVWAIVQVETSPSFAGDPVDISSSQLDGSCEIAEFASWDELPTSTAFVDITTLDNDGNAMALVEAIDCAPGQSVVEADLGVAPFITALGTLTIAPPVVTTPGLYGYPTTSGTVTGGEVEIGDVGDPTFDSSVLSVFNVETDPVYAEQPVEISSPQFQDRCAGEWQFEPLTVAGAGTDGKGTTFISANTTATSQLDDDGNATFYFAGFGCAPGSSVVTADVEAGTNSTYTTTFTTLAPQVTI